MPQATPFTVREEVIRKYLYGMKQDEIARLTGTSPANVSNIIRELKARIGQKDVEEIVTLTRTLQDGNISHVQIISAARFYNIMQQLGFDVDDETMSSFLSGVHRESKDHGIEPKTLVEIAMRMLELKPHDIPLENIPKHYEDLIEEVRSTEEKLEELKKELAQKEEQKVKVDEEVQIKLENAKTTLATLEEYQMNKKALEGMGVSIDDISRLSNMLKQVSVSGYDVLKIIEHTTKEGTSEKRQLQLKERIEQLSEKEQSLKSNIENLENKVRDTKSHIDDLEKTVDKLQNTINIVQDMEKQGVNHMQIIQWNRILKLSNTELQRFENELQKFGGIAGYITNKKSELQELEKEITNLKSRVRTLTNQKIKLESFIDETQKTTLKSLEAIGKKAADSITNVELSSKESIQLIAEKIREDFKKTSNATQKDLENSISALVNLISQVSSYSEEVGRMGIVQSICNIISKSKGDPYQVYPSCISFLQRLKIWLVSQKTDYPTIGSLDNLIGYLKKEEEKLGIPA